MTIYKSFRKPDDLTIQDGWLLADEKKMKDIYETLLEVYKDSLFDHVSKFEKAEFIKKMSEDQMLWLKPHFLRQQVFKKVVEGALAG